MSYASGGATRVTGTVCVGRILDDDGGGLFEDTGEYVVSGLIVEVRDENRDGLRCSRDRCRRR